MQCVQRLQDRTNRDHRDASTGGPGDTNTASLFAASPTSFAGPGGWLPLVPSRNPQGLTDSVDPLHRLWPPCKSHTALKASSTKVTSEPAGNGDPSMDELES